MNMTLQALHFSSTLDSSSADLIADFFVPALTSAVCYDRGVGYFSSGWLRITAKGMLAFAANGGRARWVTSPILQEEDWQALQSGEQARFDPILRAAIARNIMDLEHALEHDTLSALAWMVADNVLDFRLALPTNKLTGGDFHDKFGIFTDKEGDQVSFNGSYNESIQGTRNYESIKIFRSWESAFTPLVQADVVRFDRLWNNQDPNVFVFALPEAAHAQILQLRKHERPYPLPPWLKQPVLKEQNVAYQTIQPVIPSSIQLRPYQNEAIDAWFVHRCRGLFEMATGTGKTITALAASAKLYQREGRLTVIITVPYQHLVDQWRDEAQAFGYQPILAYQSKAKWLEELNHTILDFIGGYRNFISVITTHTTFASPDFQATIARLNGPVLLIADEAHHLGAEHRRHHYPTNVPFRLALSATPDRWFDDAGTAALRAYFGSTVFSFPLEKAIGVSLTPYYYYPHLVELTEDELAEYRALTLKIARLFGKDEPDAASMLELLLMRRARLLNVASNKLVVLSQLIDRAKQIDHTLFYCAPGQIDDVVRLLGWEKGLLLNRFTAEESNAERQQRLADFARGEIQALVAMKCLDEGVDVPTTRTAYFLASSGNPREFIQRRGRILRKSPGKEYSVIHDLIAVPPPATEDSETFPIERSILRHEMQRFKEFAEPALNKHEALDVIWDLATHYELNDF
jgi:superfamily II DNA or RNA helicase